MPSSFPPDFPSVSTISGATALGQNLIASITPADALGYLGVGSTPSSPLSATTVTTTGTLTIGGAASVSGALTVQGGSTLASLATSGAATLASLSTSLAFISGGAINSTPIGSVTPSNGAFTGLTASGTASFGAAMITAANITGGTITGVTLDNSVIGATTPAAAHFSSISTTGAATLASLNVSGTTTLAGLSASSATISGTLSTASLSATSSTISTLGVTGLATLSGGLSATTGAFSGAVTVAGALGLTAALTGTTAAFSGMVTAATPADGANNTQVATTAFVTRALTEAIGGDASPPTALVGLSAVPGSATTFMRSDAAPALDQSIAPTWTGAHKFNSAVTLASTLAVTGATTLAALSATTGSFSSTLGVTGFATLSGGLSSTSGTFSGAATIGGNLTGSTAAFSGVVTAATPADGANNTQVATTAFVTRAMSEVASGNTASPTAHVGLSVVPGSASTFMRSDAAPALDQSIAPTWTGAHVFNSTINVAGASTLAAMSATTGVFSSSVSAANVVMGASGTLQVNLYYDGANWRNYGNGASYLLDVFGNSSYSSEYVAPQNTSGTGALASIVETMRRSSTLYTFYVPVTAASTLGVTGATTLGSTLNVTGATTLAGLSASSASISGGLIVGGTATLGAMTATTGSFSGTLGVTGAATFGSSIAASAPISTVTSGAQFLAPGYMHYSDGSNYYLLLTGSSSPTASFNSLRPLSVNLSSGAVNMSNGLTTNALTVSGNATLGSGTGNSLQINGSLSLTGAGGTITSNGNQVNGTGGLYLQYANAGVVDICNGGGATTIHGPLTVIGGVNLKLARALVTNSPTTTITATTNLSASDLDRDFFFNGAGTGYTITLPSGVSAGWSTGIITNLDPTSLGVIQAPYGVTLLNDGVSGPVNVAYNQRLKIVYASDGNWRVQWIERCPIVYQLNGVNGSSGTGFYIPEGFQFLDVDIVGVLPSANAANFGYQLSADGGNTFRTGTSDYNYSRSGTNASTASNASGGSAIALIMVSLSDSTTYGAGRYGMASGRIETTYGSGWGVWGGVFSTPGAASSTWAAQQSTSDPLILPNYIKFAVSSGTFSVGSIVIRGIPST